MRTEGAPMASSERRLRPPQSINVFASHRAPPRSRSSHDVPFGSTLADRDHLELLAGDIVRACPGSANSSAHLGDSIVGIEVWGLVARVKVTQLR
jgi:hypothetical protein